MRKIKLELEKLEVTSFETNDGQNDRGTVGAYGHTPPTDRAAPSCGYTCDGYYKTCAHQTCYTWGPETDCLSGTVSLYDICP
jgi:hypothetical protein